MNQERLNNELEPRRVQVSQPNFKIILVVVVVATLFIAIFLGSILRQKHIDYEALEQRIHSLETLLSENTTIVDHENNSSSLELKYQSLKKENALLTQAVNSCALFTDAIMKQSVQIDYMQERQKVCEELKVSLSK